MRDEKALPDVADSQNSWLESRMPLREEHLCARGIEYYLEWLEAGMPRKDQ